VEEGNLFINKMLIEMLIAINNNKNRRNKEGKLNNNIYISKAIARDKTLKDT
jgi:hypothetical protein